MNLDLHEAAYAIHATSNHNMIAAIEDITVNDGLNPRDSLIVTGGGATGCHIAGMARCPGPAALHDPALVCRLECAWRTCFRYQVAGFGQRLYRQPRTSICKRVNTTLKSRAIAACNFLDRADVDRRGPRIWKPAFMGRYQFQAWEIEVPFDLPADGAQLAQRILPVCCKAFHGMHQRIYGICDDKISSSS